MIITLPTSAPHSCSSPGCPTLVPRGQGRCPAHERKAEERRGNWRDRGYSSKWDGPNGIRLTHLRQHPLCVACAAKSPPRVTPANTVDHRLRWQSGATGAEREQLFADPTNLQSFCSSCHGRKTAVEDGSFGRPGIR